MNETTAFVDGHLEPTENFDFDAVEMTDRGNPLTAEIERSDIRDMSEAMDRILFWCWKQAKTDRDFKAAFIRFAAMTAVLRPDILNNASYKEVGARLSVTKAHISNIALEFQDGFGVHFRRSRRSESRETFRKAQKKKQNL